jgi:hypothetical protein
VQARTELRSSPGSWGAARGNAALLLLHTLGCVFLVATACTYTRREVISVESFTSLEPPDCPSLDLAFVMATAAMATHVKDTLKHSH